MFGAGDDHDGAGDNDDDDHVDGYYCGGHAGALCLGVCSGMR